MFFRRAASQPASWPATQGQSISANFSISDRRQTVFPPNLTGCGMSPLRTRFQIVFRWQPRSSATWFTFRSSGSKLLFEFMAMLSRRRVAELQSDGASHADPIRPVTWNQTLTGRYSDVRCGLTGRRPWSPQLSGRRLVNGPRVTNILVQNGILKRLLHVAHPSAQHLHLVGYRGLQHLRDSPGCRSCEPATKRRARELVIATSDDWSDTRI